MAAAEGIQLLTFEFLTFESIVLETSVIPQFRFDFEVKNKMDAIVNRTYSLPITNYNYYILKL